MPTKITFVLTGCPNGVPIDLRGAGTIGEGRLRITLCPLDEHLTWDPALVLLGGLDPLLAFAAGLIDGDEPLVMRSRADVFGEGGRDVGTIVTVSRTTRERGRVDCRAQLAEARLALEVGELLTLEPDPQIAVIVRGAAAFYELPLGSTRGGDFLAVVAGRSWSSSEPRDKVVRLRACVARRRGVVTLDLRKE